MNRFLMTFDRSSNVPMFQQQNKNVLNTMPSKRIAPLNAPMIERVHKSKPGCSACGKKVM